jgi:hypothetical protein
MKKFLQAFPALLVAAAVLLTGTAALANTAANTAIINTAKLTYNGGLTAESSVTVTVALVPSTPNVDITRADSAYTGVNTPAVTNTVTVTSTANGPADYTVTPSLVASTNTKPGPAAQPAVTGGATVTIGASVTTGTSGATYITVPASGASGANPAAINGIAVGDTIVFTAGGTTYAQVVAGFTDNGNGTYRINWTTGAIANIPPSGTQVGERLQVNLSATPGTIDIQGNPITTTVQAVVSTPAAPSGGSPAPANATATTTPPNNWTSTNPNISFQKYSRNVTNSTGNSAGVGSTNMTINGGNHAYFTGGVTGKPGDTIEYVIKVINNGALDISNCAISDQLPTAYVSDPITPYGGAHIFYIDTNSVTSQVAAGAPGVSLASYVAANSPNLIVNVGVGALANAGGTIPASKSVTIAYQATIK